MNFIVPAEKKLHCESIQSLSVLLERLKRIHCCSPGKMGSKRTLEAASFGFSWGSLWCQSVRFYLLIMQSHTYLPGLFKRQAGTIDMDTFVNTGVQSFTTRPDLGGLNCLKNIASRLIMAFKC